MGWQGHGIGEETMVQAVLSEGMGIVGQSEVATKFNNQQHSFGEDGGVGWGRAACNVQRENWIRSMSLDTTTIV